MGRETEKVVRITMQDGLPVPDQDPVVIKRGDERVRWAADFEFRVKVEDYADVNHTSGSGQYHAKSGAFTSVRQYKYTISANGVDNDPMLDVKP